jgi:hypothetical protein
MRLPVRVSVTVVVIWFGSLGLSGLVSAVWKILVARHTAEWGDGVAMKLSRGSIG